MTAEDTAPGSGEGQLIVISGPSGVGKTSLVRELMLRAEREKPGRLALSVSHTTRRRRPGEENGKDYYFVSSEQFEQLAAANAFIEHARVYSDRYGTSRQQVDSKLKAGASLILEIDWQGARLIRTTGIRSKFVFIVPPDLQTLRRRLVQRKTDADRDIERRMLVAVREIEESEQADCRLVNADFRQATEQLWSEIFG